MRWLASEVARFAGHLTAERLAVQAQLFLIPVPSMAEEIDAMVQILDAPEQKRAAEYKHLQSRSNFVTARAFLRLAAVEIMGQPVGTLRFSTAESGKPFLVSLGAGSLEFNISHSGDHCLIGLACGGAVGVDLEQWRERIDRAGIAARFFTPEEREWISAASADGQTSRFYDCWTLKEALLKATSAGIANGLSLYSVRAACCEPVGKLTTMVLAPGSEWVLGAIPIRLASYSAAVCLGRKGPQTFQLNRLQSTPLAPDG